MAQNITLMGASYTDVPSVLLPKTGGGTAEFFDGYSVTYSMNGGAYATATPDTTVAGEGFTSRIKVPSGYMLQNVTVTMGGTDISSSVVTYESEGTSTDTYEVSYNLTGGAYANVSPTTALANEPFSLKLKVPAGYGLTNVSVTMGGVDVTSSVFTYESSSGSTPALDVKTITQNGTFLASDDSLDGYSEVTVNVDTTPTLQSKSVSYTPTTSSQNATITADNGYDGLSSVAVSVGAIPSEYIIPTGSTSITQNGTFDVTNFASAVVNASSWTKVGETTYTVSTTSTSAGTVGTWSTGDSSIWDATKIIYIKIRDTAGKRAGYFYGTDNFYMNYGLANGATATSTYNGSIRIMWYYNSSSEFGWRYGYSSTGYGVYPDYIYSDGRIRIRRRYNSSYSLTIDGTYKVEAYVLNTPDGNSPFI